MAAVNYYIGSSTPGLLTDASLTVGSSSTSTLNVELRIQTQDASNNKTHITKTQVAQILMNIRRYLLRGGVTDFTNGAQGSEVLPTSAQGGTYTN